MHHIIFVDNLNAERIQNRLRKLGIHFLGVIRSNQTHLLREVVVEIGKLAPFPQAHGVFDCPIWGGFLKVMVPVDQTKFVIGPRILLPLMRGSPLRFCHRHHGFSIGFLGKIV